VWPPGFTGSLTHNEIVACAAVSLTTQHRGLGIDSELVARGDARRAIEKLCCTEAERQTWLRSADGEVAATLLFSAKEAFYKAISPFVGRFVDFLEIEAVDLDWCGRTLILRPNAQVPLAAALPTAQCRFVIDAGMVHTSVCLPNEMPPSAAAT
jgi:enterobactin synthetase component D